MNGSGMSCLSGVVGVVDGGRLPAGGVFCRGGDEESLVEKDADVDESLPASCSDPWTTTSRPHV